MLALSAAAAASLVAGPAEAEPDRVAGCDVDPNDPKVVVVEATVLATQQPSYRCDGHSEINVDQVMQLLDIAATAERPTASTGCLLVTDSPSCAQTRRLVMVGGSAKVEDDDPPDIAVELDGVARRASYVARTWRACGLAPGAHVARLCSDAGPVTCSMDVAPAQIALVAIAPIVPAAQLRIDRVHRGALRAGQTLTVELTGYTGHGRIQLATHATFAWRSDDAHARATLCTAPPSPPPSPPGCARCDAGGGSPLGWLAGASVVARLALRRNRR